MTHDPLCHWATYIELPPEALTWLSSRKRRKFAEEQAALCQCDLIARVRADQREACIEEIASFYASGDNTEYWRGFDKGLAKSINLLKMGRNNG